jgi:hypothetical protein
MAVFIARAIAEPMGEEGLAGYIPPGTSTFSDVPESYWSRQHIEFLAEYGAVVGYPDGRYRPVAHVTRAQMSVYIARAFDISY